MIRALLGYAAIALAGLSLGVLAKATLPDSKPVVVVMEAERVALSGVLPPNLVEAARVVEEQLVLHFDPSAMSSCGDLGRQIRQFLHERGLDGFATLHVWVPREEHLPLAYRYLQRERIQVAEVLVMAIEPRTLGESLLSPALLLVAPTGEYVGVGSVGRTRDQNGPRLQDLIDLDRKGTGGEGVEVERDTTFQLLQGNVP